MADKSDRKPVTKRGGYLDWANILVGDAADGITSLFPRPSRPVLAPNTAYRLPVQQTVRPELRNENPIGGRGGYLDFAKAGTEAAGQSIIDSIFANRAVGDVGNYKIQHSVPSQGEMEDQGRDERERPLRTFEPDVNPGGDMPADVNIIDAVRSTLPDMSKLRNPFMTPYPETSDPHINMKPTEAYKPYGPDEAQKWKFVRDPNAVPAEEVAPPAAEEPELDIADLNPPTGALSFDDYLSKIKSAYPDLDFDNNPKQALADANAKRDLERTALLAQLQLAAGMVAGAGKSWEGLGQGFANAGESYDKGFTKYQEALQSSADRYAQQQDKKMTYDLARRKAALDLYSDEATRQSEDRRTIWKAREERKWERAKLLHGDERDDLKIKIEIAKDQFDKEFELLKPSEYGDPVTPEQTADYYRRREQGMRQGRYIPPGNAHDLTAKN